VRCVSFDRGVILCDVCYLFVVSYCKPLPPGKNPFAVNKYHITSFCLACPGKGRDITLNCKKPPPSKSLSIRDKWYPQLIRRQITSAAGYIIVSVRIIKLIREHLHSASIPSMNAVSTACFRLGKSNDYDRENCISPWSFKATVSKGYHLRY
jgi:hypothetical protein